MEFQKVESVNKQQINKLSQLASRIVKEYYDPILGSVQNDYMIEKFQSLTAVEEQLEHGYQYYIVVDEYGIGVGFFAFYKRDQELYLSKLYLRKESRGKGIAKEILYFLSDKAKEIETSSITLNVNRNNETTRIYEKLGFTKIREEVNEIGQGFVMDDYVYELILS